MPLSDLATAGKLARDSVAERKPADRIIAV
jgi:hypothetical protein